MHTCCAVVHCCQHITGCQVVVVVGMEVETKSRVALCHLFEVSSRKHWVEDAECVGQHEPINAFVFQCINKLENILWGVLHSVGPVFQIEVDADAEFLCIGNRTLYVSYVFLQSLLQLIAAMPFGTLTEQVDHPTTCVVDPIERGGSIHKSQYLDALQSVCLTCPSTNHRNSFFLTLADAGARYFNSVNIQLLQQHACDEQFFVWYETHTIRLLTIAQSRVHYFYTSYHQK